MSMSRADSLAYQASYFAPSTISGSIFGDGSGHRTAESIFAHTSEASGGLARSTAAGTMCGSDAISLLDLEDAHDDLVMIDSNGNSSGSGVTGSAVVGETMASASAIVSTHQHPYHLGNHQAHQEGLGGNSYAPSLASTTTSGAVGALASIKQGHGGTSTNAMQRVAMIAAIQQNGGAKVLAAHRVGRRQDRPSRNIRFGDFHRICEIEYEFELGKPLIANGRALVHSTCVQRLEGDEKRDEMVRIEVTPDQEMESADEGSTNESPEASDESAASSDHSDHEHVEEEVEEVKTEKENEQEMKQDQVDRYRALQKNPYAGHLENQRISRLTQVQADIVEDSDEPLLTITAPQLHARLLFESNTKRDKFITLLHDTTVAHKHHLLFQSKYLADLKKFKRHSAFSFDTSFLKTWGIPGGINLGSIKPGSGPVAGYGSSMATSSGGSHGTLSQSPLASPGGFDPYQYQQHLNRPQSMAGSLFGFALSGGSFPSFSDHSKDSSYATLKGSNATNALQYHHQQQQMLQHQLQMQTTRLSSASIASHRPGVDRTSSGSTFDPIWFLKGAQDTVRSVSRKPESVEGPSSGANSIVDEVVDSDQGDSSSGGLHTSSSGSNLPGLLSGAHRLSTLSTSSFSLMSSSSSSLQNLGTLRNGAGWVRDEDASVCMVCTTTKFGVLVRKHHCRLCGRVICWKCCQMKDASLLDAPTSPKDEGEKAIDSTNKPEQGLSIQTLRKPIRVCLDCIENENLHGPGPSPQSQGPSPTMSSFPLQGVLGKLMPSTASSPQLMTSSTTATGSTFSISHPFASTKQMLSSSSSSTPYPRKINNRANNRPPHHRASLYRIDVECVGEEDEDEEDTKAASDAATDNHHSETKNEEEDQDMAALLQLKDDLLLDDHDEEDVNSQIMTLESEVESMLLHNAAAPLMFGARSSHTGRIGGRRTGYRIPSEEVTAAAVRAGLRKEVIQDEEEEEEEEMSMEELLAQQDAQLQSLMQ
ncbi:Zinc finger FYVE domain-containing protein 26 [Podila clonocystis]|nr:Zinc finger FYVE domain-containing protein 26 [Podila clonocystis]